MATHSAPRAPRPAAFDLVRQLRLASQEALQWRDKMLNVDLEATGDKFRVAGDDVIAVAGALLHYGLALYRADQVQAARALQAMAECPAEAFAFLFAMTPDLENAFRRQAAESAPDAAGPLAPLPLFVGTTV